MLRKLTQKRSSILTKPYLSATFFSGKNKPNIAVVGGGPVGLTLCNILKAAEIPFELFEKNKPHSDPSGLLKPFEIFSTCSESSPSPAAHYINMRSMEILNGIHHE